MAEPTNPDIIPADPVPREDGGREPSLLADAIDILTAPLDPGPVELTTTRHEVPMDRSALLVPMPNPLADFDQESVKLIVAQQGKCDELEKDYEELNGQTKEAKKAWEAAVDELQRLIRERRDNRGKPVQRTLFDAPPPPAAPPVEGLPADPTPAAEDPLENLWREYPLNRLNTWGATESDISKLQDGTRKGDFGPHPVSTVGALADYTANVGGQPGFERRLTDFKGIGQAAATRIDEALEGFYRWFNTGGREEFARERGLIREDQPTAGGAGAGTEPGTGEGDQPASPGATPNFDELAAEGGLGAEPFEEPEAAGEEYTLNPDEAAE